MAGTYIPKNNGNQSLLQFTETVLLVKQQRVLVDWRLEIKTEINFKVKTVFALLNHTALSCFGKFLLIFYAFL